MEQTRTRHFRPSLTLQQMMKLVAFGAIASACVAPAFRLAEMGVGTWPSWLILEGVAIPLVLALAAFPMVRGGPLKDWLIRLALLASVGVALGFAVFTMFFFGRRMVMSVPPDYIAIALNALVIAVLGLALVLPARRIIPRRCPDCARPMLIHDAKAPSPPGDLAGSSYRCLGCGGRSFRALAKKPG